MKILFRSRQWLRAIAIVCIASVFNMSFASYTAVTSWSAETAGVGKSKPWLKYTGLQTVDDSDYNFTKMLETMSDDERIQLAVAFRMFPKLKTKDFGQYGLQAYENYADSKEDASDKRPLRPKTFNDVPHSVIQKAISAGRLSAEDYIAPLALKKELIWVSSHSVIFPFKRNTVDYHSLVQWVARKKGVPKELVQALPTFELEKKIVQQYFEELWDKLTPQQRKELLDKLEKQIGQPIPNKAAIALMGGGAALAALGATVTLTGFAFYTTMSVVISGVAAIFGITLPFGVYTTASSAVAVLAGPVGWILAGGALLGGLIWAQWPSVDRTASFIMALHVLKAHAFHEAGDLK